MERPIDRGWVGRMLMARACHMSPRPVWRDRMPPRAPCRLIVRSCDHRNLLAAQTGPLSGDGEGLAAMSDNRSVSNVSYRSRRSSNGGLTNSRLTDHQSVA